MQTNVWGPVGWSFLHCVAHGFPESPREFDVETGLPTGTTAARYKAFFLSLGHVLPCKYCRESYISYVHETPPLTESRASLTRWLWEIHNRVNAKLGVEYDGADFNTVCAKYESFRAKCSDKSLLGCTTPDANRTKKRSRVIITSTSDKRHASAMALVALLILSLVATYITHRFTRTRPTR